MGFFSPTMNTVGGQTTSTTQTLPPWVEQALMQTVDRAQLLSEQPYQPFPGPRVAPITQDQLDAFALARTGIGGAQPFMDQAGTALTSALERPTLAGIQQYMDPFDELVTQNIISELSRQNDMQGIADQAQAVKLGAFGGSRTGVVEAERSRNFNRLISDVMAQRGSQSYGQALGQFNTQQQTGILGAQTAAQMAQMQQKLNAGDVSSLIGIGAFQQAQGQQSLDLAYADFIRQQQYPYQQVSFFNDILTGVPSTQQTTSGTSAQQVPGPSIGQQLTGVGLGVLGTLGATGAFGAGGWL